MRTIIKVINIVLIIGIIFIFGFMIGKKYDIAIDENDQFVGLEYSDNEQKIRRLVSLIDNQYIDEINTDSLVDNAIHNILSQLDPHTTYIDKKTTLRVSEEVSGKFSGFGFELAYQDDTLVVTRVLPSSPNMLQVLPGDRLIKIDEFYIDKITTKQLNEIIKQEQKSAFDVILLRAGAKVDVQIKKGEIAIPSVIAYYMIDQQIGYIKLNRFAEKSAKEVKEAIIDLKSKGMTKLVFDLRENPGGLVNISEEIADQFLTDKQLIVYTQDKEEKRKYAYATSKGEFEQGKLYVLIDEYSASASEIVSGALQEYDRATIVGRRSFGKGLVQREISLGDGTRLRLTVAKYYTPSGRSIQRPYDDGNADYANEIKKRYDTGELFVQDSIHVNPALKYQTPTGKVVYGGGGIIPDIFVPIDSTRIAQWLYQTHPDVFNQYLYKKIEQNRYNPFWLTEDIFNQFYDITPIYNEFLGVIGVKDNRLTKQEKEKFKAFLKSSLAREIFGENAFYKIWNIEDNMIKKILELENQQP